MSLELQKFLFADHPSRKQLMDYEVKETEKHRIQVFRNHSFELVEHTIHAYLDYAGLGVSFVYSGYDDSMSFTELDTSADAILLWIDMTRYKSAELLPFFEERIYQLRQSFSRPILIVPFGGELPIVQRGIIVFSLKGIAEKLGKRFTDERAKAVTGTSLSHMAMLDISKELGLRYIPALLQPTLKAIIVDFDNTLYQGVLGEDGIHGVVLTDAHRALQNRLKLLSSQGYFLCAASKNVSEDVDKLLAERTDFPLKKEDFTKMCISWNPKADAITEIESFLNIHSSSMVFIDDNIGELTSVQIVHPEIKLIQAYEDATVTEETLEWFPGLFRVESNIEDILRKNDTLANQQRKELRNTMSAEDYLRSLQLKLTFSHNDISQSSRIAQLSCKTNQFIFSYKRYSEADILKRIKSPEYEVISVSLSDRLSDSGLIGVCIGKIVSNYVQIEECFVSCRALGRGIDDAIVLGAMEEILQHFNVNSIKIDFQSGPRNLPAETFVNKYLEKQIASPLPIKFKMPNNILIEKL